LLREILPGVSRSFALSLRVLPASLRTTFGVTYLVARAADTIADTRAIPPPERAERVEALRAEVRRSGPMPTLARLDRLVQGLAGGRTAPDEPDAERRLLARLPEVLTAYHALPSADRERAAAVLDTLTGAMLDALARFPPEDAGRVEALETPADLERYTYANAGCVGEFWTDMVVAHRPRCAGWDVAVMRARGVRFGQGLQLVNVLRDLPRDLRLGRCYLPRAELLPLGLTPIDLLDPAAGPRLRPLIARLADLALDCFDDALAYTRALPPLEGRLRLACALPLLIGLGTLARLRRTDALLDPVVLVKVPRSVVRRHLAWTPLLVTSDRVLDRYVRRLRDTAR
jgi:farnesyl-diphosphate farnesyltransferase